MNAKRMMKLLTLLLCVLLTVSGCTLFKSGKYQKAVELFEKQQYLEAQKWFLKIEDYEDSRLYLDYILAWNGSMNGEYDRAAQMYDALGDFRDSAAQALVCSYACAEQLAANAQYEEALAAFEALGNYRDAEARIPALHYEAALQKMAANDYESAYAHFEASNGYQDSQVYLDAENLFAQGKLDEAAIAYEAVKDVPGVETRINMIKYARAEKWYAEGKIETAAYYFKELDDYADAYERACQCYYQLAEAACQQQRYPNAARYFEQAQDYRDAQQRMKECCFLYAEILLERNQYKDAAAYFVRADDYLDAFHRAVDIKRTLVKKGKPITFSTDNELKNQQQATCHGAFLQYISEEQKFRITLEVTVPAGYPIYAFNPPNGSRFMRRIGTTTGERQEIVFEIEAEKLNKGESITVNCVKSDRNRFFVFLNSSNFVLKTPKQ